MIFRLDDHQDQAGAWDVISQASGDLAFDVGANIGQSTKVLANGFKKVIAFEPCLESFEILAVEAPHNVVPVQLAVGSVNGEIELEEHELSIRTGQLTAGDGLHWGRKVGTRQVPCRTLDRLVQDFGMPDFLKIDTEGSEVEVVRGGLGCCQNVRDMIIEVHSAGNEREIRELLFNREFTKLEHNLRVGSPIRVNHFWLVSSWN
jgi:FkbM family methyltransferase